MKTHLISNFNRLKPTLGKVNKTNSNNHLQFFGIFKHISDLKAFKTDAFLEP